MSVEKQNILRVRRLFTWLEEQITLITTRLFWMNLSTKNMCSMFGRFPVFTLLSSLFKISLSSRLLIYLRIYLKMCFNVTKIGIQERPTNRLIIDKELRFVIPALK